MSVPQHLWDVFDQHNLRPKGICDLKKSKDKVIARIFVQLVVTLEPDKAILLTLFAPPHLRKTLARRSADEAIEPITGDALLSKRFFNLVNGNRPNVSVQDFRRPL